MIFIDGECPICGSMCGNQGIGEDFRCKCGWIGKMSEEDKKLIAEVISKIKENKMLTD